MIVDTSVLVSIALSQPDADRLKSVLETASSPRISAGNLLETHIVIDRRRNARVSALLEQLLERVGLVVEPVTEAQVVIARDAYRRFGKGSGHPAQLNYRDCFAYALATARSEPLLFIGNDFAQTDVIKAR